MLIEEHVRIHVAPKPYCCYYCGDKLSLKELLDHNNKNHIDDTLRIASIEKTLYVEKILQNVGPTQKRNIQKMIIKNGTVKPLSGLGATADLPIVLDDADESQSKQSSFAELPFAEQSSSATTSSLVNDTIEQTESCYIAGPKETPATLTDPPTSHLDEQIDSKANIKIEDFHNLIHPSSTNNVSVIQVIPHAWEKSSCVSEINANSTITCNNSDFQDPLSDISSCSDQHLQNEADQSTLSNQDDQITTSLVPTSHEGYGGSLLPVNVESHYQTTLTGSLINESQNEIECPLSRNSYG